MDDTGYESDGFETSPSWRSFRDSWDESDELKRAKKRLRPLLIHLEAYDEARVAAWNSRGVTLTTWSS